MNHATIKNLGGDRFAVRYERRFNAPPEQVWAALTESAQLGQWLAPGSIELAPGGKVHLAFTNSPSVIDSTVTSLTPGSVLEYHWIDKGNDAGPVSFEVSASGGGSRLVLTHTMPLAARRPSALAAWHMHLEQLAAAVAGSPIPWSNDRWQALRADYAKQLG